MATKHCVSEKKWYFLCGTESTVKPSEDYWSEWRVTRWLITPFGLWFSNIAKWRNILGQIKRPPPSRSIPRPASKRACRVFPGATILAISRLSRARYDPVSYTRRRYKFILLLRHLIKNEFGENSVSPILYWVSLSAEIKCRLGVFSLRRISPFFERLELTFAPDTETK